MAQRKARATSTAGFTQSLKLALGGLSSVRAGIRGFSENIRDSFHISPRPLGARASSSAGFTLLLAALVASIVLALGSSIFQIVQKQVTLAGIGRDSQFAFYVADAAAECALYWDFRFTYFALTTPAGVDPKCDTIPMNADNQNSTGSRPDPDDYTMTSESMDFFKDISGGYCAKVYVKKCKGKFNPAGNCVPEASTPVHTLIHADGYNVNCASISTSPRALQRSVELLIGGS